VRDFSEEKMKQACASGGRRRAEVTIGVNNMLDTDPPNCFSCQLNGFDPNTCTARGQFGYRRLTWRP